MYPYTADTWPIATCMHAFKVVDRSGVAFHDAPEETWDSMLAQVAAVGFTHLELSDAHIRIGDLSASRRTAFLASARQHGVEVPVVHVSRRSVIMPGHEADNLAYAHRAIDAAAEWGMSMFSTGLHQPFTEAQERALWFWTAQGPKDPDDADTWKAAVRSIRELGRHAADVGLPVSLELYEDTYLGTGNSAVRFVEEVGLSNVGLNPDAGNLIRLHREVEDWEELYALTLPYANYWHMKNYGRDEAGDGRWAVSMPSTLETGIINYRDVVRDAVRLGYRGIFLMEQYGGDSLGVCASNREYVRGLLRTMHLPD